MESLAGFHSVPRSDFCFAALPQPGMSSSVRNSNAASLAWSASVKWRASRSSDLKERSPRLNSHAKRLGEKRLASGALSTKVSTCSGSAQEHGRERISPQL